MKRISKANKAIADAHIAAAISGNFDDPQVRTKDEVIQSLKAGKTFSWVLDQIEIKFMPTGTVIVSRFFGSHSNTYKAAIYRAFKQLLDN